MENINKTQKLTVKDLVTIAIISVLYLLIRYAIAMIIMPSVQAFMIASGAIDMLLCAPLYMVMANRVAKRGVFVIYATLVGVVDGLMGYLFLIPYFILAGIICELVMLGKDTYIKPIRNTLGWACYAFFFSFGNYIAVWFAGDAYSEQALANGLTQELLGIHRYYYTTPLWIFIISGLAIAGALLGSLFGHKLLKRHFKKAGVV